MCIISHTVRQNVEAVPDTIESIFERVQNLYNVKDDDTLALPSFIEFRFKKDSNLGEIASTLRTVPNRQLLRLFLDNKTGLGHFRTHMPEKAHERASSQFAAALVSELAIRSYIFNGSRDGLLYSSGTAGYSPVTGRTLKEGDAPLFPQNAIKLRMLFLQWLWRLESVRAQADLERVARLWLQSPQVKLVVLINLTASGKQEETRRIHFEFWGHTPGTPGPILPSVTWRNLNDVQAIEMPARLFFDEIPEFLLPEPSVYFTLDAARHWFEYGGGGS
ncbi:hypothetical protein C8J56DRAFT_1025081 [Mycena floridula]|nr:hypothetical protein C8J56DRAFT_1025081 [Mycena floridula]